MRTFHAVAALLTVSAFGQQPEAGQLLEKARSAALNYTASLPDFLCTQVVRRYEDLRGDNRWLRKDTLTIKLSYSGRIEDYKLIAIDGKPTDADFMSLGGPTTKGEFGTILLLLFHPDSQADFHWKGWTTIRKHRVGVFTYKVDKAHSLYRISYGPVNGPNAIYAAYHGELHVDPDSGRILHVIQNAEMPLSFPINRSNTSLDYDYAEVGGHTYLLPARAITEIGSGRYHGRNEVEFKDFRKFQTEATITFDR
jgi:hypothetical protein